MTTIGFETLKEISILMHGRKSPLVEQAAVSPGAEPGPPSLVGDGVALSGAIVAWVGLRLRENAATQKTVITLDTADDSSTYTVRLGGETYTYAASGGDAAADILEGLRAAIAASSVYTVSVDGNTLIINGVKAPAYAVTVSATATGELSEIHEGDSATLRFWGLPADPVFDDAAWFRLPVEGRTNPNALVWALNNWLERISVAGLARLFIEVVETNGAATPLIGPAELES